MSSSHYKVFTSESVSEGHPDKVADQVSDAILDAALELNPNARVACETLLKNQTVVLAGEMSNYADIDFEQIVRDTIRDVGYTELAANVEVIPILSEQSADIAQGVDGDELGAGDQGMMFGYATKETDVLMPAPIYHAHQLVRRQAQLRRTSLSFLKPDAKSQVSLKYENGHATEVTAVVFSTQHDEGVSQATIHESVQDEIIQPVLGNMITRNTKCHINPTGVFVHGGPEADCGLTGRKVMVDTYGGAAHHGGGAFSGKDPTKVDRSAAYGARYVAKNVVSAGLAERCEIQVSYAIGVASPTSVSVNSFGTGTIPDEAIAERIERCFDLRPAGLIAMLNLQRPLYRKTAAYGHFGREESDFTWERTDRVDALKQE